MNSAPKPRRTRADAMRNRERILRTAVDLIVERGSAVPMEMFARRAGVGVATLYRHFPDRSVLFRRITLDVLTQLTAEANAALAEEPDAFTALTRYLHRAIDLRVGAVIPMLADRVLVDEEFVAARDGSQEALSAVVRAAHDEGSLRQDVGSGDIGLLMIRMTQPLPVSISNEDNHRLSHRHLELVVDGLLRFLAVDALPGGPLGLEELGRISLDENGNYKAILGDEAFWNGASPERLSDLLVVGPNQDPGELPTRLSSPSTEFPRNSAWRAAVVVDETDEHGNVGEPGSGGGVDTAVRTGTLPVSIYLSETAGHEAVEAAVSRVMELADAPIVEREDPVLGSWFRRMRANPAAREIGMTIAHVADTRLVHEPGAHVTATLLQHIGPVITSLAASREAVVRLGTVLIVKVGDQLVVHQLTAAQQFQLDHQPQLAMEPRDILASLGLSPSPATDSHRHGSSAGVEDTH